eukprot:12906800-Prorocentrum_lima.AAC.1
MDCLERQDHKGPQRWGLQARRSLSPQKPEHHQELPPPRHLERGLSEVPERRGGAPELAEEGQATSGD